MRAGCVGIALVLAVGAGGESSAQTDDPAAARVNGVAIYQSRLQSSLDAYMRKNKINAGGVFDPSFYRKMRRRVLDVLIAQELLWQEAMDRGLAVSGEEAEAATARVEAKHGSESAFLTSVREGGFDDAAAYTEDLKRRLSVQRLIAADIAPAVSVGEAEIARFYADNTERFQRPEEVRARHVLIEVAGDADDSARQTARARIDAIHERALNGADFAALARQHSEGPSASRGGDLGFFGRGRMVKHFEDAAFALETGGTSTPVLTRFGYHVIRVEARRGGGQVPLEEASARIAEHLKRQKIQAAVAERAQGLRATGDVVVIADL
jgi:parvulin-like peptidyl-prolyl isomerase